MRTHYGILHDTGSDFIPVMLYDWRSLPTQYRRRIIELKDRYDAIWQTTLDELHAAGPARRRAEAGAADDPRRDQLLRDLVPLASRAAANRVDLDTLADETVALVLQTGTRRSDA